MHIELHGAAGGVTGSCFLVATAGRRILADCRMFQGGGELHEENAAEFGFDPARIDVLLLTHAHLDHCGRIPLLVKCGFRGEIIATSAMRDLTGLILLDSAHLHEVLLCRSFPTIRPTATRVPGETKNDALPDSPHG